MILVDFYPCVWVCKLSKCLEIAWLLRALYIVWNYLAVCLLWKLLLLKLFDTVDMVAELSNGPLVNHSLPTCQRVFGDFQASCISSYSCSVSATTTGQYGVPRKWYFLFQPSFWLGEDWRLLCTDNGVLPGYSLQFDMGMEEADWPGAELDGSSTPAEVHSVLRSEEEPSLRCGVAIKNLKKIYNGYKGTKLAVNNLSLNFYEGQITSFLGHNGAGKTTTM